MNYRQLMEHFVALKGGKVRFDAFAEEHLLGKHGFYSHQLDMREGAGKVSTPSFDQKYIAPISLFVSSVVLQRSLSKKKGEPVVFAEIGGGNGNFKKAFLGHWDYFNRQGASRPIEYISVEPNPNHREAQSFAGRVVQGTAQKTGLAPGSVDALFDDEVLDCMPFRLVKFNPQTGAINYEAFVALGANGLQLCYGKAEIDEGIRFYASYLKRRAPYTGDRAWSDHYAAYWNESLRILTPGGLRLSIDYSVERPSYQGKGGCQALVQPYEVDLTHCIDFELQVKLAQKCGFLVAMQNRLDTAVSEVLKKTFSYDPTRSSIVAVKG